MRGRRPTRQVQRGATVTASPELLDLLVDSPLPHAFLSSPPVDLTEIEDRRRWSPGGPYGSPVARVVRGGPARLTFGAPVAVWGPPAGVRFEDPSRVLACVRRRSRREVLHALRRTGKGSRARRRVRRAASDVSCR